MPTNRNRRRRGRVSSLNDKQRTILLCGTDFFHQPEPGIDDDDHARALWEMWRDELLEDQGYNVNMPGRRPWAFWKFEARLRMRTNFGWIWPRGCRSEEETVHKFHADDGERAQIEAHWRLVPASAPAWFRRKHRSPSD